MFALSGGLAYGLGTSTGFDVCVALVSPIEGSSKSLWNRKQNNSSIYLLHKSSVEICFHK
jgi:hypothetical protein